MRLLAITVIGEGLSSHTLLLLATQFVNLVTDLEVVVRTAADSYSMASRVFATDLVTWD
jgi:hypothetical protein